MNRTSEDGVAQRNTCRGAFFGARLMHKVTYAAVQRLVAVLLVVLGLLIAAGAI